MAWAAGAGRTTPAQLFYAEGQRFLQTAEKALQESGAQKEEPQCPTTPLACELNRRNFQQILKATEGSHDLRSLFIRSLAAKQLAIESFAKLQKLPDSPELHRFRSEVYREQNRYQDSAREMRRAFKLSPNDRAVQVELGAALFLEQDYRSTLPELTHLQGLNPSSAKLNFFVGHSLAETQQLDESLPYLERSLKLDPFLKPAHLSLGLTLARLGKFEEAVPHLRAALSLDTDGMLYYQLSRAYRAIGQEKLGEQMMSEYQKRQQVNDRAR